MIVFDFSYSPKDCARAWRRHLREKMNLPVDVLAILIVGGIGLLDWYLSGPRFVAIFSTAAAALLALMLLLALIIIPNSIYRRMAKLRQRYHLQFSDEAIEFRTDQINSHLQWDLYKRVLSDRHSYLLYYEKEAFTIIPKRVATAETLAEFETMLRAKISSFNAR